MFDTSTLTDAETAMLHAAENNQIVTFALGNAPNPKFEFVGMAKVRGPEINAILFTELKTACVVKVEASIIAGSGPGQRRDIPHLVSRVTCEAGKGFFELTAAIYRE